MNGPNPGLTLLALALITACAPAAAQEPVAAVWKEHLLHFSYRSFEAIRSCYELEKRIVNVLNVVGARPDLEVTLSNCNTPFASPTVADNGGMNWPLNRPETRLGYRQRSDSLQVVDVRIRLSIPVEMTPDVVLELKADRKRRELIAHVTGDPLPIFDDPIAFPAQRKVVRLSNKTTDIEPADCELLDQMAARIFKALDIRVVQRRYSCNRWSVSHIPPTLDVEALVPVTFKLTEDGESPAPGGDQPSPRVPENSGEVPAATDTEQKPE